VAIEFLRLFLMGLGVIATGVLGVLLMLYRQKEREQRNRLDRAEADMAEVVVLFQTMRDILNQQKSLAKEFNQEIDRKLAQVKQVLSQSVERNQRLYGAQQQLQDELDEAKAQLESLQRQLGYSKPQAQTAATKAPARPPAPRRTRPAAPPQESAYRSADAFRELADELSGPGHQAADGTTQQQHPADEQGSAPESPKHPEAARAAFRALLDLGPGDEEESAAEGNNGPGGGPALQQRVIEYHEAGMSVTEIAKELGLGKGEVRLMLNLAQKPPES